MIDLKVNKVYDNFFNNFINENNLILINIFSFESLIYENIDIRYKLNFISLCLKEGKEIEIDPF